MCGIAGFWSGSPTLDGEQHLERMCAAIAHRGPDAQGIWTNSDKTVFLGHRRLAIVDLSDAGLQPMQSHCGRYHVVYNGEIYNHLDIRKQLETDGAINWRGHSDTETLLQAFTQFGFEKTLNVLNGMFAIALWDTQEKKLFLARDRMGEKPLYYTKFQNTILFASELHAFRGLPNWQADLDATSVDAFLRYSSVPAPLTIYKEVYKLPPAHYLCLSTVSAELPTSQPYWDLPSIAGNGTANELDLNDTDIIAELQKKLLHTVDSRTLADVPLGSFLSGGIDSSLITALMQSQSMQKVKTFTIGFEEKEYNEAPYAAAISNHLGTEHTELYVNEKQALDLVPRLGNLYDEPFADSSQIPTLLLSSMTARHVKVSLSGDGGDELFYGYSRYPTSLALWNKVSRIPHFIRKPAAGLAHHLSRLGQSDNAQNSNNLSSLDYQRMRIQALHGAVGSAHFEDAYRNLLALNKQSLVKTTPESPHIPAAFSKNALTGVENKMMLMDMQYYLPDVVLTKVDRASMAYGLESRAPLLDHQLVEYAWTLPQRVKSRDGISKWALQKILHKYVPRELFERPKMGFGVPIDHWLRGELKEWSNDLLNEQRLKDEGHLDHRLVGKLLHEHRSGKADRHFQLWPVLMFQSWLDNQRNPSGGNRSM